MMSQVHSASVDVDLNAGLTSATLWSLEKGGSRYYAELRFRGKAFGWECQFFHQDTLLYTCRAPQKGMARAEAEAVRANLERDGWVLAS